MPAGPDNKDLMKEIGQRLRLARQNAGYKTIPDFIHQYNFAKSTYTQYEIGARALHIALAIQFAALFKTNLIWLLTGKGSIGHTDSDLVSDTSPEKISQDESLSILTKKIICRPLSTRPTVKVRPTSRQMYNICTYILNT